MNFCDLYFFIFSGLLNHSMVFLIPIFKPFFPLYLGVQLSNFFASLLEQHNLLTSLFLGLTLFFSNTTLISLFASFKIKLTRFLIDIS